VLRTGFSQFWVLLPIGTLLLLLAKPFRPWLFGVAAILLYLVANGATGLFLHLDRVDISQLRPWVLPVFQAVGFAFLLFALVLVGWILRRLRAWQLPIAGLAFLTAIGLLILWLFPGHLILAALFLGLPSHVLQFFFLWLVFKSFVVLQEHHFLSAQILHSHLCWGFLTIFILGCEAFYAHYQWWALWMVLLAYPLYVAVLHLLNRGIWMAHAERPGKRLLLLRVFGRVDRREKLLDTLDDTWRRIGRVDLIAGTDLAMRAMGSRMLESFLLRRTDEQFLKTAQEVDQRLERLQSRLEGDARYPLNAVYCYASAWQRAVTDLAPKSDAVLMDLRGFSGKNEGCVFELGWVVQHISLSRVILLTDASSDDQALERVTQAAWERLPFGSPNAGAPEAILTILNLRRRQKDGSHALFGLLLRAAYPAAVPAPRKFGSR
jgi:hypothetical protein